MGKMGNPIAYLFGKDGLRAVEEPAAPAAPPAEPSPPPADEPSPAPSDGSPDGSPGTTTLGAELISLFAATAYRMAEAASLLCGYPVEEPAHYQYISDVLLQVERFIPGQLVPYVRGTLVLLLTGNKELAAATVNGDSQALIAAVLEGLEASSTQEAQAAPRPDGEDEA
jgi:hypothetical protein